MNEAIPPKSAAAETKACCAAVYGSDVMPLLLGGSYHPGGLALTRRLAEQLRLCRGDRVLDVATGRGTSALLLAGEYHADVTGVDLSPANIALASDAARTTGLVDQTRFLLGDADRLPVENAGFDAVMCECAFCTFPSKPTAAAELARVLRPGGLLGIADVTAEPTALPPELSGLSGWIACLGGARPLPEYTDLLTAAGLTVTHTERHDASITAMLDQVEARLALVRMTARDQAEALGVDFDRAPAVLAAARTAIGDGVLGYALLTARKPE
ncbi:methyltransferase domain-containing protein [Asanoa sp. NPDC050611]|uniref:class I SAM-dependent methyltransferase n=1 Tax=Asanoa sp. NPDC050611 TaxID=3157098 RepID=UPI0033D9D5A6